MKKAVPFIALLLALCVSCGDLIQLPPGSRITLSAVSAVAENTSATIVWTTDIPSTHVVRYGTASGVYSQSTVESASPAVLHSVTLTPLSSDMTYYFIVENNAAGAETAVSGESSFATASSIPINALSAGSITLSSATITWDTGSIPATHLVEYGTAPGAYTFSTIESAVMTTAHSVPLSGLASSTTYYYRVKNFNPAYPNVGSTEQSFATLTETPPTSAQKQRGIWIVGGLSTAAVTSPIAQIDLYDPVTGAWYANVTSLPTPVSFPAVASCGGKIYVMGGFNNAGTVLSLTQEYTVSSNSWTTRSPVGGGGGFPRANVFALTVNGRIYVLGGTTANYNTGYASTTTSYEYYPGSDAWTAKTPITMTARSEILELGFNDLVYHVGGRSAGPTVQNTHDGLVVTSNVLTTSTTEVALTAARTGHSGALYVPNGNPAMMVVVGGFSVLTGTTGCHVFYGTTTSTSLNAFQYLYYPFTAPVTWQNAVNFYPVTCGFSAAAVSGSILYVFGGASSYNSGPINSVYSFNLDNLYSGGSGSWTACANMPNTPNGRYGHRAVTIVN